MKIKLWKENKKEKEYEMKISDIIKGFKNSKYYERHNVYRWLPVYIMDDLKSVYNISDADLIFNEFFKES